MGLAGLLFGVEGWTFDAVTLGAAVLVFDVEASAFGAEVAAAAFDFDFELAIKLLRKGYVALELPVNYRARSFSAGKKVSMWRDPPSFIRALAKFRTSPLYPAPFRRSGRSV